MSRIAWIGAIASAGRQMNHFEKKNDDFRRRSDCLKKSDRLSLDQYIIYTFHTRLTVAYTYT